MRLFSPLKSSPLFRKTSILFSAHTKSSGRRAAFRPGPTRQKNQARTKRKTASQGKGQTTPTRQEPGKGIQRCRIQESENQERRRAVRLEPHGCYAEEILSQRSNNSPHLPRHWFRHSLRWRVVARTIGLHRALICGLAWT